MHSTNRVKITGELYSEDYNNIIPKVRFYNVGNILPFTWVLNIPDKKSMVF